MLSVEMKLLVLLGWRYLRVALILRYLPRLLDAVLREGVPHRTIRRPLVWWLMRRLLR